MKKLFLLITLLVFTIIVFGKKKKTNSYEFLKNQQELNVVIDYNNVMIHGLNEQDFLELQAIRGGEEWKTKWEKMIKKELYMKLTGEINAQLIGKYNLRAANYPEANYCANVLLLSISNKGTVKAIVTFTKNNSSETIVALNVYGSGGTFGSTENLMGDGFQRSGRQIGLVLDKKLKKL